MKYFITLIFILSNCVSDNTYAVEKTSILKISFQKDVREIYKKEIDYAHDIGADSKANPFSSNVCGRRLLSGKIELKPIGSSLPNEISLWSPLNENCIADEGIHLGHDYIIQYQEEKGHIFLLNWAKISSDGNRITLENGEWIKGLLIGKLSTVSFQCKSESNSDYPECFISDSDLNLLFKKLE